MVQETGDDMPHAGGRTIPLSLPRRFICDLVYFAKKVPLVAAVRRMQLASLVAARREIEPRPSWSSLFTKAFGLVAQDRPELRRMYMPYPWPHLYEHTVSIASVAVEREWGAGRGVFFGQIHDPARWTISELDSALRGFKNDPVWDVKPFRRLLRITSLPRPLRRLLWGMALYFSGRKRVHYHGTFGVAVSSNLGTTTQFQLSTLTATLNYGVISADGTVDVRLTYDHRVLDGGDVARTLDHLESVLRGEILAELGSMRKMHAA
jgi:hypothetical protein